MEEKRIKKKIIIIIKWENIGARRKIIYTTK